MIHSVLACAACYGQSDSPMAYGLNWGILTLLGFIVPILGCIAGFAFYLAKKAAAAAASATPQPVNSN